MCRQLIGNPIDDRFIRRIVTCDVKRVDCRNPDASKQWLGTRKPAKVIVKKSVRPQSNVCLVEFEGLIHWEFVPNRRSVDEDIYSQQLE